MDKKYFKIYSEIKNNIINGAYENGKLPSKRVTANFFGVSVITVETAYAMLEEEGFITAKERSGYFVSDGVAPEEDLGVELLPPPLDETVDGGYIDKFEYSVWFKTVRKVISEKDKELFAKAPAEGCAVLRNAISAYLRRCRNIIAPPERIIIGSGAEQLYENAVKILGRDKIFGTENPCYKKIIEVYQGEGVSVCPLEMSTSGIKESELKSKKFGVLHVTPFSSYPTMVTADRNKRLSYLEWARANDGYIIEDDFASEFHPNPLHIKTLYSLSTDDSVIYINTFSKTLSPSMRIGYMVLPEKLVAVYHEKLGRYSCSVPVLDQYVLAEFIKSGNFERHLNRVRRKLATR